MAEAAVTASLSRLLPPLTPEDRELAARIAERRIAMTSDLAMLRLRYEEVMRWANPPWDTESRRIDPRPEEASPARDGRSKIHVDMVGQAIDRWATLTAGVPMTVRVVPEYVAPPDPSEDDPNRQYANRRAYEIDATLAQMKSTHMENTTRDWMRDIDFHRTMFWTMWSTAAFGKAIARSGWDPEVRLPTFELMENPSQVAYAWSKRYGRRTLAWVMVVDQMLPSEAAVRFGLDLPIDEEGYLDFGTWTGSENIGDMDVRPEQTDAVNRMVWVEEYWELDRDWKRSEEEGDEQGGPVLACLAVAGRVVEKVRMPWRKLPFHVFEDAHVATYMHGRSVAERLIGINAAYDDMLTRQQEVIDFESGPRYKGINMANSGEEAEMPGPFEMLPLREGEDIQQIDTRVDFYPTQAHAEELRQAMYHSTGLTPIAWGMSPNAQTSGRALTAEWRAVELPLTAKLINITPEVRSIISLWWDFAEKYHSEFREIAEGYRKIDIVWEPLDIRDASERTLDTIQLLNANLIDPETAMQKIGIENSDEVMARVKQYLVDPVYNPLRYQQYLILQQLSIQIQQAQLQLLQMQQSMGVGPETPPSPGGALPPDPLLKQIAETAQQGANAAGTAAQGPAGPVTEAMNQPGAAPAAPGGMSGGGPMVDTSVLSQTPMQGGVGNRAMVRGGPAPTAGNVPQ
jgi:hypothetical protein